MASDLARRFASRAVTGIADAIGADRKNLPRTRECVEVAIDRAIRAARKRDRATIREFTEWHPVTATADKVIRALAAARRKERK